MTRNIIRDGYTRKAFIAAQPGIHEELRCEFRPMLPAQVDAVQEEVQRKPARDGHKVLCAALREQLVSWSEADETGKPVAIAIDNIRRLPPRLYNRLYDIVSGRTAGDPDPTATAAEEDEYVKTLLEAAETGQAAGAVRDDRDLKNSATG